MTATSKTGIDSASAKAAIDEADAVCRLHDLNARYVRAFAESDTSWYDENLSDDFLCTLADGRRINKPEFLQRTAEGPRVTDVTFDDVDVRPFGDFAVVHGVTHYKRGALPASARYTGVWQRRSGRWQAVAAHVTNVSPDQTA